ncbi:MLO-like protein 10 isoform X2 [Tripterygium wilfordii]|uniref:MLO-like protein 10 isoform X2 n=1 Tax=Tripterygium wilfordii TaxID=458696 RepID=UPI0018F81E7B|nr:MLO-like protein 10 isoform X2 [Tripterygium wilfordii]
MEFLLSFSACLWWFLFGGGMMVVMAATSSSSGTTTELDQTPTWAVACVCAVIIIVSILLEKILHKLGTWFTERHKRALFEALEKVKAELMILGFISLLLTFGQTYFIRVCVSPKVANTMLPCAKKETSNDSSEEEHRRRLLWLERRSLAAAGSDFKCNDIRGWKEWEQETSSHDYEFSNDPSRFRLTHETSFVRAHTSFWTRVPLYFYIGCFFRQFFRSVNKADYLTLRNGFINVHLAPGSRFNFQKYIKRSLEDDFKTVVGISPVLWASFVIYLLINVNGWQALFWASILPVIIILAVGTKLQAILTKMAIEITERHVVVQGMPVVQLSDSYFWFGRPQLVLHLIHFALFQNAFQITYFLWIWYSFGLKSCFHSNFKLVLVKIALGLAVLIVCSYITLPLHALVTQMGSRMKKSIFDEQTSKALKKWHMAVKKRHRAGKSPTRVLGESVTPEASPLHYSSQSSAHKLHRFKTTGHSTHYAYEDHDMSDVEADPLSPTSTSNLIIRVDDYDHSTEVSEPPPPDHEEEEEEEEEDNTSNEAEFSFVKAGPVKET